MEEGAALDSELVVVTAPAGRPFVDLTAGLASAVSAAFAASAAVGAVADVAAAEVSAFAA